MFSSTSPVMPQPVSWKTISAMPPCSARLISRAPPSSMLSRALTTRLTITDLISWALTRATIRCGGFKRSVLAPRVVDLMGDARRQETHAGQAFGADQLPAALVDLAGEVAVHLVEPAGHVVEGGRQILDFVTALDPDLVFEIALGHLVHAVLQVADRVEDPAVKEPQRACHQQDTDARRAENEPEAE